VTGLGVSAGASTGGSLSGALGTTYYYKVTAINPNGESLPYSEVSLNGQQFAKLSTPGAPSVGSPTTGGSVDIGTHSYKVTFVTANGETTGGTASGTVNVTTSGTQTVPLTAIPTGATGTTARNIYRTVAGNTGNYLLVGTINNNTTTTFNDTVADASLGVAAPSSNSATTSTNNASLSWNAVTGATSYRIYRGTSSNNESVYQTSATNSFTDTGAAGTAGSVPTASKWGTLGVGTSSANANIDVEGTALFRADANSSSSFQIQNPGGASILTAGNSVSSSTVINENLTTNTPTGTLLNNATYSAGNYVQLTNGSSSVNGELDYTPALSATSDYSAQFEVFYAPGFLSGNSIYFYAGFNSTPTDDGVAGGGYLVDFDDHALVAQLKYNGTQLASANISLANSTWYTVKIVKSGTNIRVFFNGSKVIDYTDSARTISGTHWGLGSWSNPWSYIHRVRNFLLTQDTNSTSLSTTANSTFKASVDSSTAFQIQNASAASLFTVDTTASTITLGSASATPVLLVLGNKNTAGDPTCTNGAIYYNSSFNQLRACVNGSWTSFGNNDGWVFDGDETWTYASATSFIVAGDVTGKYTPGTRIKATQSAAVEYFVVTSSSYSSPNTTVNITGGTDYSLANSAISANAHSYAANPQGYPGWFNFNASATGFSSMAVTYAKFAVFGRQVTIVYRQTGTSNATSFHMTAPIPFADAGVTNVNFGNYAEGTDNGVTLSTPSGLFFASSTDIRMDEANGTADGWTATGTKSAVGQITYPF
jgi:hypothetical protein